MNTFNYVLRALAIGIFGVALIHILLGVSSEPLLGSGISELSIRDPNLDSQNRFYGAAFALYGAVLWICSADLQRYRSFLLAALGLFFLAGLTRVVSALVVGWPALPVIVLAAIEIFGPPAMFLWFRGLPLEPNEKVASGDDVS
ncbi:MAG: hypothetical protein DHS20C12_16010 [Pseudohongiella sp.]|nr:MAG: hypothetical protein DHS20C12_16010 [Pseudohongiella sp.]